MSPGTLRFGDFELDPQNFEIRHKGRAVKLHRTSLELLILLAERAGQLVTYQEAFEGVWGRGVFIDVEGSLYTAVRKIRRVLGDDPTVPHFIETVARKGYRFVAPVRIVLETRRKESEPARRTMLAVLPFVNLSGDPRQEYFSDGLTEDLITELAKLSPGEMGVIARTSVMAYKGTRKRMTEIGRELRSDYLIEGSARQQRGRVRISVQLIRVNDETHAWAESYDSPLGDMLCVHAAVARVVAETVRLKVAVSLAPPSAQPEAEVYDLYLRARYLWDQRTAPAIRKAIQYFEKALERDSSYAPAWAGMGTCDAVLPITGDCRPRDCFPQAIDAASRALALNSTLAEAHVARGIAHFWFDWDWLSAEQDFCRACELNPSDSSSRMFLAHLYSNLARHTEAIAEIRAARQLDPLSLIINTHEGQFLYNAGRYEEASRPLERVLELAPDFWVTHIVLGKVFGVRGRSREALAEFAKAYRYSHGNTEATGLSGYTLGTSGRAAAARRALAALKRQARRRYVPPVHRALILLGLGERVASLEALESAAEERDVRLTFLAVEPRWNTLRQYPRFERLYSRVGLPSMA